MKKKTSVKQEIKEIKEPKEVYLIYKKGPNSIRFGKYLFIKNVTTLLDIKIAKEIMAKKKIDFKIVKEPVGRKKQELTAEQIRKLQSCC